MSWPTPEMYRRHGLGLLSLKEAREDLVPVDHSILILSSLVRGLPPVSHECLSGPAYVKEGGLRKVNIGIDWFIFKTSF